MKSKHLIQTLVIGMAVFSMFFGGGNLSFPLWIGSETSSPTVSFYGFFLTGVLLPFYGLAVALYFGGDYHSYLNVFGKRFGALLIFFLLLFWIPLGSGPRCNLIAWGAFESTGFTVPLALFSALYSLLVFALSYRESRVLEVLGKFITPALLLSLFLMIVALFSNTTTAPASLGDNAKDFMNAFFAGYHTQDFIAAIFFATTVISIVKEREGKDFNISLVRNAFIISLTILGAVYIGLIFMAYSNASVLSTVSKERLFATLGQLSLNPLFQPVLFFAIFLSALSTSIALTLVFADYIRKDLFQNKINHPVALFITVLTSYFLSVIGFDNLAVVISYAMNTLYPTLLFVVSYAFIKSLMASRKNLCC